MGVSRNTLIVKPLLTVILFASLLITSAGTLADEVGTGLIQTDVNRAEHVVDRLGLPKLSIDNVGVVTHPAWTALYALAYAGVEDYEPALAIKKSPERFMACVGWLATNLRQNSRGAWVWSYEFDNTYNDISVKAPWSSAFAQAVGIQALLAGWRQTGSDEYLELAKKAAESLFVPLKDGGFLFERGSDIWFEEVPVPHENPGHILNGHMRALLALRELSEATGDVRYQEWFRRGLLTLEHWLPRYDAGYWLRYDLNPRKGELLFRFANPYGFSLGPLAVDRVSLRDPLTKQQVSVDVGAASDAEGKRRIAGTHWGQTEIVAGRSVRRLAFPLPSQAVNMRGPHSYLYFDLPGHWQDNLRNEEYELVIDYYDESPGNVTIQMRSVAPGLEFRDIKSGDLLLTGSGVWRQWVVPIEPESMGYWVGDLYARKHVQYLHALARDSDVVKQWHTVARGYLQMETLSSADYEHVPATVNALPDQTPMLPHFQLSRDGVVLQEVITGGGNSKNAKAKRSAVYHPYMIADQLRTNGKAIPENAKLGFERSSMRRQPALNWLLDANNQVKLPGDAVAYHFSFDNAYNDVFTKAPWVSSFSQAHILKALRYAQENMKDKERAARLSVQVINSYKVPVREGGIVSLDRFELPFFEEVPNETHVLNAHLASVNELLAASGQQPADSDATRLARSGIAALRAHLPQFDTGYWFRYDQNPKKTIVFQLDWLAGETSPLIESAYFQNPETGTTTVINVGKGAAFDGESSISGTDWLADVTSHELSLRGFQNGYKQRDVRVKGGAQHNVFLKAVLPSQKFENFFDVPAHRLVVRYLDVAPGRFAMKVQAIHEGNELEFVALRNGVLETVGDNKVKEAVFVVRPEDMGWFKGADYQSYETEQLRRIAAFTDDWFLKQYAERQQYFLDAKQAGRPIIVEPPRGDSGVTRRNTQLVVRRASATYPKFGFENALDGDANDDYVAGVENVDNHFVELSLNEASHLSNLKLDWESLANHAGTVRVFSLDDASGQSLLLGEASGLAGARSEIKLRRDIPVQIVRVEFSNFSGQSRLLLRLIELH